MPLPKPLLTGTMHDYGIGALVDMPAPEPAVPSERRLMNLTLPPWQQDMFASAAAKYAEGTPGRSWRSVEDTTHAPILNQRRPLP